MSIKLVNWCKKCHQILEDHQIEIKCNREKHKGCGGGVSIERKDDLIIVGEKKVKNV